MMFCAMKWRIKPDKCEFRLKKKKKIRKHLIYTQQQRPQKE